MKEGFALITGLDEAHNNVHRQAFLTPETTFVTTVEPTVNSLKLGEMRIYYDRTDFWLFCKLSKTQVGKTKWTIV